jgi:hypothetical protein
MQAMRALLDRFDYERYTTEEHIDGKRCDALVVLEDPHETYGDGFVVEYQHKNEQKDIEATERHYARNNLTTLWLWEDEFSFEGVVPDVDLFDGRVFTPWPQTVPTCDEWSGTAKTHRLRAAIGDGTTTRVEANIRLSFVLPSEQEYWKENAWIKRFRFNKWERTTGEVSAHAYFRSDQVRDDTDTEVPATLPPNCVDNIIYNNLDLQSLPEYQSQELIEQVIDGDHKHASVPDATLPPGCSRQIFNRDYKIEYADELRHKATDNGWRESFNKSPFENLRSALELTSVYTYSRPTVLNFASLYVTGLGGGKVTQRAIDRMTDKDDSEYSPAVTLSNG